MMRETAQETTHWKKGTFDTRDIHTQTNYLGKKGTDVILQRWDEIVMKWNTWNKVLECEMGERDAKVKTHT